MLTGADVFNSAPALCGSARDSVATAGRVAGGPDSFYGGEESFVEQPITDLCYFS